MGCFILAAKVNMVRILFIDFLEQSLNKFQSFHKEQYIFIFESYI